MSRLRRIARVGLGTAMEILRPGLARQVDEGVHSGRNLREKHWILQARLERAKLRGDQKAIEAALAGFWKGETGDFFYARYRHRFDTSFLGPHRIIVSELVALNAKAGFRRLVEVGCGDGQVLDYLATEMPSVEALVGIDINPTIIERNHATYADRPRLSFEHAHAGTWLPRHVSAGTVLLTYGGVMEYFSEPDLRALYTAHAGAAQPGHGGANAVALVEPLAPEHDMERQRQSFVFGAESSFSHNYPFLLADCGYDVVFAQEMNHAGVRWQLALALTRPKS